MRILGIDWGERKIGLAISEEGLAEPLGIILISNIKNKILDICQRQEIEKIVIGLPEGKMARKVKKIAAELAEMTGLPVEFQDETLTSHEAIVKMRQIGKRIKQEDAISAALILQAYLEKNV